MRNFGQEKIRFREDVLRKVAKYRSMEERPELGEIYRVLRFNPEIGLAAADVVGFIEFLIPLAEKRRIRFKIINRNEICLELRYVLKDEGSGEKEEKTNVWQVRINKFYRPRRFFGKLFRITDAYFRVWIRNKSDLGTEAAETWEVWENSRELLAFRLGKLMEVVFQNLYRM